MLLFNLLNANTKVSIPNSFCCSNLCISKMRSFDTEAPMCNRKMLSMDTYVRVNNFDKMIKVILEDR